VYLEHRHKALEAHASVNVLSRQGLEVPGDLAVELNEDKVPHL
jgi:hypothetical protein